MPNVIIYDTRWEVVRGNLPWNRKTENNPFWDDFRGLLRFMGSIGFYVAEDKAIKKNFPILNKYHRYGRYGDLEFKAEWNANVYRIEFYQNVNYENQHGGYYDFDKRKKMPYLIGKQYEITAGKLKKFFEEQGYTVTYQWNTKKGAEFIIEDYIRSWNHTQKDPFTLSEVDGQTTEYSYNSQDRDKKTIYNGETKYFRDWSGYLARGKVYHNINNMWWVLLPDGEIKNIACFNLFDLTPDEYRGRKKEHRPPKEYTERKEQLAKCSAKELERELKRRKHS